MNQYRRAYACLQIDDPVKRFHNFAHPEIPVVHASDFKNIQHVVDSQIMRTCHQEIPNSLLLDVETLLYCQIQIKEQTFVGKFLNNMQMFQIHGLRTTIAKKSMFREWEHAGKKLLYIFNDKKSHSTYPLSATIIVLD